MPLSSILGHAAVVDLLGRAAARGSVPQSLLFVGPEGVGKLATAVALAQALNCPNARGPAGTGKGSRRKASAEWLDACGACPTCRRIAAGQHADVTLIDKAGEASIKIRVIRERLLDSVGYRPFEARRRVYIIDGADELTVEAQDALLKTLEEPPPAVLIVLVTAYPDTLLGTVQSRCRRLRFGPLSPDDIARILVEREQIAPATAKALATVSGGSVSAALAAADGGVEDDEAAAVALVGAAASGQLKARLGAATALARHGSKRRDREALAMRLAIVSSIVRDLGALATGGEAAVSNTDLQARLGQWTRAFPAARTAAAFSALSRAQQALERNASPKIVADWVALWI